jgi:hypothetical protein
MIKQSGYLSDQFIQGFTRAQRDVKHKANVRAGVWDSPLIKAVSRNITQNPITQYVAGVKGGVGQVKKTVKSKGVGGVLYREPKVQQMVNKARTMVGMKPMKFHTGLMAPPQLMAGIAGLSIGVGAAMALNHFSSMPRRAVNRAYATNVQQQYDYNQLQRRQQAQDYYMRSQYGQYG